MEKVVIVAAKRTAIGSFGGVFKDTSAVDLATNVIKNILAETNIDVSEIDEVILGNVLSAGLGQNIARQIAINSGLPVETPAYTLNMVCGSGMKAIEEASIKIMAGLADCILVGGTENMSQAPYLLTKERWGNKMGDTATKDSILSDGLVDAFSGQHMGITAEILANKFNISRYDQDDFALESQVRAQVAIQEGKFVDEIVPIPVKHYKTKEEVQVVQDQHPRFGMVMSQLKALNPVFKEDGSVTAGNSSGINDGAACLLLMSQSKAESLGLQALASVRAFADAGVEPSLMGMGPVPASRLALERAQITIEDMDLVELNEAFAAQALYGIRELGIPMDKVNVNGGAIALGHPIGASGARIVVTLIHEMIKRNSQYGLATLCIGGGMGSSLILERE